VTATVHGERTRAGLQLLKAGIHQAAELTVRAAVVAAHQSAKGTARFKDQTGGTRGSIRGSADGLQGFVEARGAARFLEEGTQPHLLGTVGKLLRFTTEGQVLYRRYTGWIHPGTAARPFMHEARERGLQAAEWGAELYVNAAIQRAHG
jgi:hypothetical protein